MNNERKNKKLLLTFSAGIIVDVPMDVKAQDLELHDYTVTLKHEVESIIVTLPGLPAAPASEVNLYECEPTNAVELMYCDTLEEPTEVQ